MQAPRYINTSLVHKKNMQYAKEIHEKRLQNIKSRKSGLYDYSIEPIAFPHIKNR